MKLRSEGLPEGWEDIEQVLYYQGLPYISKVIHSKLISRHHDDFFTSHFGIEKTCELIARKYYLPTLWRDVKAYVKGCDVCLDFKGNPSQAIRRSSIIAHSYSLVERPINRLCYRPSNLSQLKAWQLRLDIGYHQPAYENGTLQASQDYDRCTRSSKSDHRYDCAASRSFGVNYNGLRLVFYIKVLVLVVLLSRHQKKAIYSLLPLNRWPDQETK